MQKLTNKEEEIMHILWKLKKAFVKEVQAEITEDQPHYNTLSTIIRNLEEKGYVS
ncbi:MAG TPA: BlaI/MecI/CopY family transcriptional regulator, partial [Flavobacterium sp.]